MNGPLELTQFNVSGDSLDANDLVATIEEDDEKEKQVELVSKKLNHRFIPADWGHSSRFVLFCSF